MRAAEQGQVPGRIEVVVDSESDDRGILGIDDSVPAGPLSSRARVRIGGVAAGRLEALIRRRLDEMAKRQERIGEARGIGAMWALEFVKDRRTKEPDVDLARAVQAAALRNGLIVLTAGFYNNCSRLLPPINTPLPLMEKALDLLEDSLDMAVAGKGA